MSWLTSTAQKLSRSPSPAPAAVSHSSVLETTRNVCTLVSNLGSGALNVPGLQAAGLIGCQIIDIVQKMKDNQEACYDLVDHIGKLMSPIHATLQGYQIGDIDSGLQNDINKLHESLLEVEVILRSQLSRRRLSRALSSTKDAGRIEECKQKIDRQLVAFEMYSLIAVRMGVSDLQRSMQGMNAMKTNPDEKSVKMYAKWSRGVAWAELLTLQQWAYATSTDALRKVLWQRRTFDESRESLRWD